MVGGFFLKVEIEKKFFPTPGSLPTSIGEASSDNEGGVKKTKWLAIYVTQDFERFCESRMRSISD